MNPKRTNPPKPIPWQEIMGGTAPPGTDMHLTPNAAGCPNCGTTTTNITQRPSGGTLTWTRPANECCNWSINREISWREAEIQQHKQRADENQQHINNLKDELAASTGRDRARLEHKIERSQRIQAQRNTQHAQAIRELRQEINRLKGEQ